MSTKIIIRVVMLSFAVVILIGAYLFRSSLFPEEKKRETSQPKEEKNTQETMNVDRIKTIEDSLAEIQEKQKDQDTKFEKIAQKKPTATPTSIMKQNGIMAMVSNQASPFTTTSTVYASMGLYVNITCPRKCILWTNFYTSSKNTDTSDAVNSYGLFLDGGDTTLYNKATIPVINNAIPLSLNAALPVAAGTHTVEIKAKTSGGTLQSDISYLQVMAIEQ